MTLENDISVLAKIGLFSDFNPDQLRLVAFGAQKRLIKTGTELFQRGEKTDCGYAVMSGRLDLIAYYDNQAHTLGKFTAGSLIGEMALIAENERVGTAIARTDTVVLRIPRTVIHRILDEYPDLAVCLHRKISASVLDTLKKLESIHPRLADAESVSDLQA